VLVLVAMLTMTLIWWNQCRLCVAVMVWKFDLERIFHLVKDSCCIVHWREKVRRGESVDVRRNYIYNEQSDHAVYMWLLVLCLSVIRGSFHRFCWKTFLKRKQTKLNKIGDKHTWICPIETLVCNCWTNDYNLDQLDAVTVCHLDYSNLPRPVHLHCKL
jgi:hypothetical protein